MIKQIISMVFSMMLVMAPLHTRAEDAGQETTTANAPSGSFISIWRTTFHNASITLPLRQMKSASTLVGFYNYNFTVDWGDGTTSKVTEFGDDDKTHIYAKAGDYTVTIDGLVESWSFF